MRLVLDRRPAHDRLPFALRPAVSLLPDSTGGQLALTRGSAQFRLVPPTVHDAAGRASAASIIPGRGDQAALQLDPVFLATAAYPVTISPVVVPTAPTGPAADEPADQTAASTGVATALLALDPATPPQSWGPNWQGQLGNGTSTDQHSPVAVSNLTAVSALSGGGFHTLALTPDGTAWAWGANWDGQLGSTTTQICPDSGSNSPCSTTPLHVVGLDHLVAVAGGGYHSLALRDDGSVWDWGPNWAGQLGDGTTTNSTTPVRSPTFSNMVALAGGRYHSLGVRADGTVWGWGANDRGTVGNGTTTTPTSPVQARGLTGVVAVAAGQYHSLALKRDGTVRAWGANDFGQLGDHTRTDRLAPQQVPGLSGVVRISAGGFFSLAVKADGTAWAWGANWDGALGSTTTEICPNADGDHPCSTTPLQVSGISGVTSIAGAWYHSLALKSDGTVWAWGPNWGGQLGDGTGVNSAVPVRALTPAGMTTVSAGAYQSLAAAAPPLHAPSSVTTTYTYDKLYRLTGAARASGLTSYSYDPVGNRVSKVLAGATTSYGYDRADRITAAGGATYIVNGAGNETARGSDSFAYDQANRLTSSTVGGTSNAYAYDGDGKRVSSTVGGNTTRYVYDVGGGLPVLLDDGTQKYVWGRGLAYTTTEAGTLQGVYHTDGLGSVRAITDSTKGVVQTYQTDEFGIPTQAQGASPQPFGYTGEQVDSTGLVYLRARMYDPTSGRFLQRDPLPESGPGITGWNRYAYAADNPVSVVDHSGLCGNVVCSQQAAQFAPPTLFPPQPIPFPGIGYDTDTLRALLIRLLAAAGLGAAAAGEDQGPQPQYVVRGGLPTAQSFRNKADEIDPSGRLLNASVQTFPNTPPEVLGSYLRNGQIAVTTLAEILAIPGATVVPDPILSPETGDVINPYHALLSGITPEQAEALFFTGTRPNINRLR